MPISTREARSLTTTREWPIVEASLPAGVKPLTPARLRSKVARARALRDKYVGLAKRQYRDAQRRRAGTPDASLNERTTRKAELFSEVLGRLEAALAAVVPGSNKAPRTGPVKARAKKTAAPTRTVAPRTPVATNAPPVPSKVKATRAPLVPKAAAGKRSGQQRIQAHVSSRGRRRQASRDRR